MGGEGRGKVEGEGRYKRKGRPIVVTEKLWVGSGTRRGREA